MYLVEQIAELDERIRKAKFELSRLEASRARMMKERWEFKKRLREAREFFQKRKLEKAENNG
jgi:hypothetical protein